LKEIKALILLLLMLPSYPVCDISLNYPVNEADMTSSVLCMCGWKTDIAPLSMKLSLAE
jgi:hypothetical protein